MKGIHALPSRKLILLMGGRSRRMGTDKAFLEINGERMLERVLRRLDGVGAPVVVCNQHVVFPSINVPVVRDHWDHRGPLAGIHAGLSHGEEEIAFVVACDMPFASAAVAHFLMDVMMKKKVDAVVPRVGQREHPLFAVYHRRILPIVESILTKEKDYSMHHLLRCIQAHYVEQVRGLTPVELNQALFNMNHPGDHLLAKAWLYSEK
ncbi:molybdenum cofactor guanylyltransferase [Marininema halotolerans]|uniref:Probable molybdenum cofactor guanylyltransferase n=1 Tax=Marininema halotolerans TaxID=1155944 RepID=A0A1I6S838_9BACL|nr:molybdenum cofactor guanylyltransferase [Marininema halotolerans]SFS73050.1 molybdopterin-guanine dinucleotide biosynthesis protein A [Marininema halotolerans]